MPPAVPPSGPSGPSAVAPAIRVRGLTKRFGDVLAVDDLSFDVHPGRVTGFLGPNGSGKTTTLRMLLGLVTADAGTATVHGQAYAELPCPMRVVGASLEASHHPSRTGRNHLRMLAPMVGVDDRRCDEVLEQVGLAGAARRKVGGYSLGMRQRLGLAATLLGDPQVLVLDEPANGLDPAGIVWLRDLLRQLAAEGRTVLVSSHVLSEVQATVDDVVIIAEGRLVHSSPLADLAALSQPVIRVQGPDLDAVSRSLAAPGRDLTVQAGAAYVRGVDQATAGAELFRDRVEVHGLQTVGGGLEETFLRLVSGDLVGNASPAAAAGAESKEGAA